MEQMDNTPGTQLVTDDDKLWALLSWVFSPLVPIIVLLIEDKKERAFIKYHAIQALAVGVLGYVLSIVLSPIGIGCFIGPVLFVVLIVLGVQAYQAKWTNIPVVTDFCKDQGWISEPPVA